MRYCAAVQEVPFVKPEQAAIAREMERRIIGIRQDAGVIFVGVSDRPTTAGEEPIYYVWLGCERNRDEETCRLMVLKLFDKEVIEGRRIQVESHRGIVRYRN